LTRKGLLTNADDFGLCPEIDGAIFRLARAGRIGGTSVLVNLIDENGLSLLGDFPPSVGIGVHASFTLGPFCGSPEETAGFLAPDGRPLKPSTRFIEHARLDAVELELTRQVEKALSLGLRLTHLDSHHHAHRRPDLMAMFARVALRRGLALRSIDSETRSIARGAGAPTSDHFIMEFYDDGATLSNLEMLLSDLPSGVSEMMSHPAIEGPGLAATSGYVEGRYREYELLASEEYGELLDRLGIELVGWDDISR